MQTRYGIIPDDELEVPRIPKTPSCVLNNYLAKLYAPKIDLFKVSVNGPYDDKNNNCGYIQVERKEDIKSLQENRLFLHSIKRWRLNQSIRNTG